ncbi:MAG: phosphoglycerate mutase family protein [Balneolaceae bacterium]|nr:phosphoglycerate mutase family protein [Balneolaceae bacterium]
MKKLSVSSTLFLLCFLFLAYSSPKTQEDLDKTTFILVRHAEKADDGTEDPPLNEMGWERAAALANHLKETDITAIYCTNYKRTRQTVQQIADEKGLEIRRHDPFAKTTLDSMFQSDAGGTVLISGHSNTTPMLVNQLIGQERYQQFEDSDYDNLFIVTASEKGKGTVVKLTF